jgi:AraC family transcriptional regulator, positive regulator of tynA and feaB
MPTGSLCRHEFVSTDGLRPDERFAFWRHACLRRYEPLGPAHTAGERFTASVRKLIASEGEFTDLRTTPLGITRTQKQCQTDGVDNVVLTTTLNGGGAGWFGEPDRATRLGGSLVRIRDQRQPYVLQWTGSDNHTLHVELPRAGLDSRTLDHMPSAGGTLMPPGGLAPMLAAQMRAFASIAPALDPSARAIGLHSVLDLAATVLRLEFGSEPAESGICEDGLFVAAQALIHRRFTSADLSPDEIARRLGCSRAHLYRIFARHGLAVASYLREVRLKRCRAALAAAAPSETIANIAFRFGFDNPIHFAHLFRQRFGMRPGDARRHD